MDSKDTLGIGARLRELTGGFGRLLGLHLKIAQLEFRLELRSAGERLRGAALLLGLGGVGYMLTIVGVAILIGGQRRLAIPFVAIGLGHLVIAGLVILSSRIRKVGFMGESTQALRTSIVELHGAASPARHRAEAESDPPHVH